MTTTHEEARTVPQFVDVDRVTIRFAGDSGDGMQLTGTQFTHTAAIIGNDLSTFPDFPAEIRAPAGSLPGVSGFQVSFSSNEIYTPGDAPDVFVAMNPAALKTNLSDLMPGGLLLVNTDEFTPANLHKAAYKSNPLEDGSLRGYQVIEVALTSQNEKALEGTELTTVQRERCKNMYALGIMYWLYDRPLEPTLKWLEDKFGKNPRIAEANQLALKAGYNYAETVELSSVRYHVRKAHYAPGQYRAITGNEATAMGFLAASLLAKRPLFYASYPITPASDVLHELARYKNFGVKTFQAEDEIAAIGAAIGASFGGALALTGTSGPGVALKSEAINLAVMTELPVVIANIQRAGPSTGMPTKAEQSDLLQAMFGRNGDSSVAIVAPATPDECFRLAIEAFRIATRYMVPTFYLSDAYLANGAEPWRIPSLDDFEPIEITFRTDPEGFGPYDRDPRTLARPWAVPGTPGLEHRIGGLEKADFTGNVNYTDENHQLMTQYRWDKVQRIQQDIPPLEIEGPQSGRLLVLGWGSTYGSIRSAVEIMQARGLSVGHAHLRYLNPLPSNVRDVLASFDQVLIPEMNMGQLSMLIRARFLVDAVSLGKVAGKPFKISEVLEAMEQVLDGRVPDDRRLFPSMSGTSGVGAGAGQG
jgi:2-oxoglutarate ferredoxin oxidoreductase subunit alpha